LRIALLEDNDDQAELLKLWLTEAGHVCNIFASAKSFLKEIARESYDLFLLDWEIPVQSGFEVLTWVRENVEARVPVMFVTARDEECDIVAALNAGADDYLIKPLRKLELTARLALGRRARRDTGDSDVLDFPPYRIDTRAHVIQHDGLAITLKEYEPYSYSAASGSWFHADRLETIWGLSRMYPNGGYVVVAPNLAWQTLRRGDSIQCICMAIAWNSRHPLIHVLRVDCRIS
jgi:DNA-binding response OmpR family regulator